MKDAGEILIVAGCKVRIRYAEQGNPVAVKNMCKLLEQQKMITNIPEKLTKTDKT